MSKYVVVIVDLVSQLADVVHTVVCRSRNGMPDPVDEGSDGVHQRYFGPLLQIQTFVVFQAQTTHGHLIAPLFQQIFHRGILFLLLVEMVEEPQRE